MKTTKCNNGLPHYCPNCDRSFVAAGDEMGSWRPIDTAPKDGTVVLVCQGGHSVQQGAWNRGDSMCMPHWMTPGNLFDPTHWMPLPEPPQ